jgi:membrane fusion protein (multidrug efflux system)
VDGESKAQFRPVSVGQLMNDRWIIAEGLHAGERVVVDGGIKLAPGVTVKPVEPDAAGAPTTVAAPKQG